LDKQELRNDWNAAAKHLKTYIESDPACRNTSRTRSGGGGRGGGRKIAEANSLRGGGGGGRGDFRRRGGKLNFSEDELKKAMSKIRRENNLSKDDKNFFIPPDRYDKEYGALEHQAIFLMRGGKSRKRTRGGKGGRDEDASEEASVSAVSVLTSKVDSVADSVAKLAQLALRERRARDEYSSDDDKSLFTHGFDDDDEQSVASSKSKRRKTSGKGNRNHPALNEQIIFGRPFEISAMHFTLIDLPSSLMSMIVRLVECRVFFIYITTTTLLCNPFQQFMQDLSLCTFGLII
jgi:hypothetical protein